MRHIFQRCPNTINTLGSFNQLATLFVSYAYFWHILTWNMEKGKHKLRFIINRRKWTVLILMKIISLLIYCAACVFQTSLRSKSRRFKCAVFDDDGWKITVNIPATPIWIRGMKQEHVQNVYFDPLETYRKNDVKWMETKFFLILCYKMRECVCDGAAYEWVLYQQRKKCIHNSIFLADDKKERAVWNTNRKLDASLFITLSIWRYYY